SSRTSTPKRTTGKEKKTKNLPADDRTTWSDEGLKESSK
ncbi:MAG: hypothetical protein ACI8XO_004943, partial [Verrucomicrobiales bacterium]